MIACIAERFGQAFCGVAIAHALGLDWEWSILAGTLTLFVFDMVML